MSSERKPQGDRPAGLLYSPKFALIMIVSLVALTALMPIAFLLIRGTPWSPPILGEDSGVFEQPGWSGYWKREGIAGDMPDSISLTPEGTAVMDDEEGVLVVEDGLMKITAGTSTYLVEYDDDTDRIRLRLQGSSQRYEYVRESGG